MQQANDERPAADAGPVDLVLGPLPEAGRVVSEPPAFYKDDWKHHKLYTAEQMGSYAAQQVALEREQWKAHADAMAHALEVFEAQGSDKTEALRAYRVFRA